ncbi:MAG: hypothetical protein HC915_01475 [Anaerolineae bacterium]|nr:hypothetical protein [Anaerolineae bacterium]
MRVLVPSPGARQGITCAFCSAGFGYVAFNAVECSTEHQWGQKMQFSFLNRVGSALQQKHNPLPLAVDFLIRLITVVIATGFVYLWGYLPAQRNNTHSDVLLINASTIAAANAGKPFQMAHPEEEGRYLLFNEVAAGQYDAGLPILLAFTSIAGDALLGSDHNISNNTVYHLLFGLFVVTALLFAFPNIPLVLSIASIVALTFSMAALPFPYDGFAINYWGSNYAAILLGVWIATRFATSSLRKELPFLAGLGTLLSLTQFLRQESLFMSYAVFFCLFVATWTVALIFLLRHLRSLEHPWRLPIIQVAKRISLSVLILLFFLQLGPQLLTLAFAASWNRPFNESQATAHDNGHNLYLGLGYVLNPYNIAWRDNVSEAHLWLVDYGASISDGGNQRAMRGEWFRITLADPATLVRNLAAKFLVLQHLIMKISVVRWFLIPGIPLIMLAAIGLITRRPRLDTFLTWMGFVGLLMAGAATPMIIYPSYHFGYQGSLLATIFLFPTALWVLHRHLPETSLGLSVRQTQQTLRMTWVFILTQTLFLGALVILFVSVQEQRQQEELDHLLNQNPRDAIEEHGYRFGHFFNRMTKEQQQNIIEQLQLAEAVWLFDSAEDPVPYFRPILLVPSAQQVHLIVWLGDLHITPDPGLLPATAYFIRLCPDCTNYPLFIENSPYDFRDETIVRDVQGVHDNAWNDQYRMFSFAVSAEQPSPEAWGVGLQRLLYHERPSFHLILENVSSSISAYQATNPLP